MAIEIEQADAVSKPYFSEVFTENVYRQCALLSLLKRRKRMMAGGTEARWPINIAELGTTRATTPRQQIKLGGAETMTAVKSHWSYYKTPHAIYEDERVENVGDQAVVDLMARKASEMADDMATTMGRDLYEANAAGLNAMDSLISTAAFGGVDEATFRSTVKASVGTLKFYGDPAGEDSLTYFINKSRFGTKKPTHIFVSTQDLSELEGVWAKQTARVQIPQSKETIELGFPSMTFMGVELVGDQFIDQANDGAGLHGSLWGIDIEALICYESKEGTNNGSWKDGMIAGYPGSLFRVFTWCGQLTVVRRRTSFKITGANDFEFGP